MAELSTSINDPIRTDPQMDQRLLSLLRAVQTGDQLAFAELFDRTQGKLLALILRIVRIQADAEDVLVTVYQQVWERPMRYSEDRGSVMAWLYVIARTRALDHMRKAGSQERNQQAHGNCANDLDEHSQAEIVDQEDWLQALQEGNALRVALQDLKREQRDLLELAFFQQLSHDQIANQTGLPLGTVKSHIRRGQQTIRQHLLAQGVSR